MTCDEFRDLLDGYVAGRLAPPVMEAASRHASGCDACRDDLDAAVMLAGPVAALPRTIPPPSDLWPSVARRIQRSRWRTPLLAAAAALVLMAAASLATMLLVPHPRALVSHAADSGAALMVDVAYEARVASLERALERDRDRLDPATVRIVEHNLEVIDRAIAESREALARDPGNRDLRALLESGHEQKLSLLEQVTRMAREL